MAPESEELHRQGIEVRDASWKKGSNEKLGSSFFELSILTPTKVILLLFSLLLTPKYQHNTGKHSCSQTKVNNGDATNHTLVTMICSGVVLYKTRETKPILIRCVKSNTDLNHHLDCSRLSASFKCFSHVIQKHSRCNMKKQIHPTASRPQEAIYPLSMAIVPSLCWRYNTVVVTQLYVKG